MKKIIKALVLVLALSLVLAGCQYLPGAQQGHTHTLVHFAEKAPTCTNNGILEHWYCAGCNTRFSDEAATTEIAFADLEVDKNGHTPGEDDGDCTTAVACTVCDGVAIAAKEHTPGEDDGDCTTEVMCTECTKVAIPAKEAHEASEDDGDCTTAVICKNCEYICTPAAAAHTPNIDAATCTEDQICTVCEKVLEKGGHTTDNGTCGRCNEVICPLVEGTGYYMTANNGTLSLWFKGTVASGRFSCATTEAEAVPVYIEAVDGGYHMYILVEEVKNYINMADKAAGGSIGTDAATATVYEWNATLNTMVVADDANNRAMGSQPNSTHENFSAYDISNDYAWAQFVEVTPAAE